MLKLLLLFGKIIMYFNKETLQDVFLHIVKMKKLSNYL